MMILAHLTFFSKRVFKFSVAKGLELVVYLVSADAAIIGRNVTSVLRSRSNVKIVSPPHPLYIGLDTVLLLYNTFLILLACIFFCVLISQQQSVHNVKYGQLKKKKKAKVCVYSRLYLARSGSWSSKQLSRW